MSKYRDVSPFLQKMRDLLMGRKLVHGLRWDKDVATRSPPLPNLPDGPSHKLNANYYYTRDGRRETKPPLLITPGYKQLGKEAEQQKVTTSGKRPGTVYNWDM